MSSASSAQPVERRGAIPYNDLHGASQACPADLDLSHPPDDSELITKVPKYIFHEDGPGNSKLYFVITDDDLAKVGQPIASTTVGNLRTTLRGGIRRLSAEIAGSILGPPLEAGGGDTHYDVRTFGTGTVQVPGDAAGGDTATSGKARLTSGDGGAKRDREEKVRMPERTESLDNALESFGFPGDGGSTSHSAE